MKNLTIFAAENQLKRLKRKRFMIDDLKNTVLGFYSEDEVKALLAERLRNIAEGTAVLVPHEEVKNHIKEMLHGEH